MSEALRGSPRVAPATARRVRQAANRLGYQINPLVSSVLGEVRRRRASVYRGLIAAIEWSADGCTSLPAFHRELMAGITEGTGDLGFRTELFWSGLGQPSFTCLNRIFLARGVVGVIMLPAPEKLDGLELDWGRFACACMDHCLAGPRLHTVVPDHHVGLLEALECAQRRGYRRPGLVVQRWKDQRILLKWSAAFNAFNGELPAGCRIPVFSPEELDRESFLEWFRRERPDLVVGHRRILVEWMEEAGFPVPQTVGFLSLNHSEQLTPCAGLDQQPRLFGRAALEEVVAQIGRYETGVPEHPRTILTEVTFRDGPTLRSAAFPSDPTAAQRAVGEGGEQRGGSASCVPALARQRTRK